MGSLEDFSDSLANEVISEMADGFFSRRAELEARINLFHTYVERFRAMERMVVSSAGFLNLLLVDRPGSLAFFKAIGVEDADALVESRTPREIPLEKIPSALTAKGRFTKLTLWGYDDLTTSCHEYIHGCEHKKRREKREDGIDLSYNLLKAMRQLINEEVSKVNANISPTALLQSVRQFDVAAGLKERALDAGAGAGELDKRLAFHRIDFDSLGLKSYPELPRGDETREKIRSFCKSHYTTNRHAIKSMLSRLKNRIQTGTPLEPHPEPHAEPPEKRER